MNRCVKIIYIHPICIWTIVAVEGQLGWWANWSQECKVLGTALVLLNG